MLRAAAIALMLAVAFPAAANDIGCTSADETVRLTLSLGTANTLDIKAIALAIGDETWSSDAATQPGGAIHAVQAFENLNMLLVDLADAPGGTPFAWLRAYATSENGYYASGGVFAFAGKGAWVVDCSDRE